MVQPAVPTATGHFPVRFVTRAPSARADERVQHLLSAGVLEIDFELVAFDGGDGPVAELAVEDTLTEREVGAALVAQGDRRCARFDDSLRFGIEPAFAAGTLEARAAGAGAHRLSRPEVRERVCAFGPLGAPKAFAAS